MMENFEQIKSLIEEQLKPFYCNRIRWNSITMTAVGLSRSDIIIACEEVKRQLDEESTILVPNSLLFRTICNMRNHGRPVV